MTKYVLGGLAALAVGVALASPSWADHGGDRGSDTEHKIIVAQMDRNYCRAMEKQFLATHTKNDEALRLYRRAKVNCNETDDFSTWTGDQQMRRALTMALAAEPATKKHHP